MIQSRNLFFHNLIQGLPVLHSPSCLGQPRGGEAELHLRRNPNRDLGQRLEGGQTEDSGCQHRQLHPDRQRRPHGLRLGLSFLAGWVNDDRALPFVIWNKLYKICNQLHFRNVNLYVCLSLFLHSLQIDAQRVDPIERVLLQQPLPGRLLHPARVQMDRLPQGSEISERTEPQHPRASLPEVKQNHPLTRKVNNLLCSEWCCYQAIQRKLFKSPFIAALISSLFRNCSRKASNTWSKKCLKPTFF